MGRGKTLSEYEKGKIDAYSEEGRSCRAVAKLLKRSKSVVNNYMRLQKNYGIKKSPGRKKKLNKRAVRSILRSLSNQSKSIAILKSELDLNASRTTIWRVAAGCPYLKNQKMKPRPALTEAHIQARLKFAENHMTWDDKWNKVCYSDEKKFNLDGPDGWRYYWHDLRKDPQYISKRAYGGGSVMVWAGFGWGGTTDIEFVSGRLNSVKYTNM